MGSCCRPQTQKRCTRAIASYYSSQNEGCVQLSRGSIHTEGVRHQSRLRCLVASFASHKRAVLSLQMTGEAPEDEFAPSSRPARSCASVGTGAGDVAACMAAVNNV